MDAVVQRLERPLPRVALLLMMYVALAFAALGANPFKGQTITPFDVLLKQRAWAWVDPGVKPRFSERSDILNSLVPFWTNAREQVRSGQFPTWNDTAAGGTTMLVANNSMFTPGFAIFAATPDPALGFHLAIIFNLAVAGLGMHLFLRRRLGWLAAACGGATFMFCGFHAAWLYWPHVFTSVWAPWLLLAIDHCAKTPRMRNGLGIAAATTMVILGGFPFVTELVLATGGLYFLVLWARRWRSTSDWSRFAIWYVAGSAIGLFLCGLLLLEFVTWFQQFDFGYRNNRGSYLDTRYLSRLLPPWAYKYKRVEQTMYVGLAMTALATFTVVSTMTRWRRPPDLVLFGLLLLVVSFGLVFGLWPMWLVGWAPGMAFNSWSRSIIILDIALITLGACAVDQAWQFARKRPARLLQLATIVVVIAQAGEMATFFHRYNGAVPGRYYYPEIPATTYLRAHAGPFDYVVTDRSFDISGELAAYGLRDLFAHQFRTPAQKRALEGMVPNHFHSHTASRFRARDIDTESQLLADFNARYLVVSSHDPRAKGPGSRKRHSHTPLPPQPGHQWLQQFEVTGTGVTLQGISVRLATYQRKDLQGLVTLNLEAADGRQLASADIDAATVVDNQMGEFFFSGPVRLQAGRYTFALVYRPTGDASAPMTAWSAPDSEKGQVLLVDNVPQPGVMEYLLHTGEGRDGYFHRVFTAAGISVLENTRSPNGPYFLPNLDAGADRDSGQAVTIEHYRPDAFSLRYSGHSAGYIVIPMSMTPGWSAAVAGQRVDIALKDGVMPAIRVTGPSMITFEYKPLARRWLLPWSAVLLCSLGLLFYFDRRTARKDSARNRGPERPG